jgi:hypothetical protein
LAPLLYARSAGRRPLTRSGVYYLPFAQPDGPLGAGTVALHVADGSEIVSQRVGGSALQVSVGGGPYGACLSRLTPARLADGWLPILETRYSGYTQESFAARVPETKSLVSFVRVTGPGEIRLTPTVHGLRRSGNRLVPARGHTSCSELELAGPEARSSSVGPRTRPGSRPPPHPAPGSSMRGGTSRRARP